MRFTRRELAALIAGTPAAARAALQPQSPQSPGPGPQFAAEDLRKEVAAIRALKVPFETEPAVVFRAQ
jgi:hypothetical protein